MEYGLDPTFPIYAGGLGILAGDHMKSVGDLRVPVTGIGLLWDEGYTRQVIGVGGAIEDQYPKTVRDVLRRIDARVEVTVRGKKVPLQFGKVYIPRASMHIFILSNEGGWLKQVILSQLDVYKKMKGIMLTMGHAFANIYTPVAMPVVMNKYDAVDKHMTGKIGPASPMYEEYNQDLLAVEQDQFAKWMRLKQI